MQRYIIRRIMLMIPTLFGLTFLVFVMVRLVPGDIVTLISGDFGATSPEVRARILADFGLDQNIPKQYVLWLGDLLRFDLGQSLISGRTVTSELSRRLPVTIELGLLALFFTVAVGIPVGIISAIRQNSFSDYAGRSFDLARRN